MPFQASVQHPSITSVKDSPKGCPFFVAARTCVRPLTLHSLYSTIIITNQIQFYELYQTTNTHPAACGDGTLAVDRAGRLGRERRRVLHAHERRSGRAVQGYRLHHFQVAVRNHHTRLPRLRSGLCSGQRRRGHHRQNRGNRPRRQQLPPRLRRCNRESRLRHLRRQRTVNIPACRLGEEIHRCQRRRDVHVYLPRRQIVVRFPLKQCQQPERLHHHRHQHVSQGHGVRQRLHRDRSRSLARQTQRRDCHTERQHGRRRQSADPQQRHL